MTKQERKVKRFLMRAYPQTARSRRERDAAERRVQELEGELREARLPSADEVRGILAPKVWVTLEQHARVIEVAADNERRYIDAERRVQELERRMEERNAQLMESHSRVQELEARLRDVVTAHKAIIAEVTPGHPNANLKPPRDEDRHDATWSAWHRACDQAAECIGWPHRDEVAREAGKEDGPIR